MIFFFPLSNVVLLSSSPGDFNISEIALLNFAKIRAKQLIYQKQRVLVFNKARRYISHGFLFESEPLECVKSYKYLGIHFTASGSFTLAQDKIH
jgi:hypothetical protein